MITRPTLVLAAAALGLTGLASCGSGGGEAFDVTSTKTECKAEQTSFDAGKLTFRVTNKGSEATELYVLGKGDKVISEVENVGPGTSRRLTVDLEAGKYELACKPGQKGDGIRVPITVTGAGGSQSAASAEETAHDREVEVKAREFHFTLDDPAIEQGEKIEFKLVNEGTIEHEFEVIGPDGDDLGEVGPTEPGEAGEVVLEFTEAGTYTYKCGIDDHAAKGLQGTFEVT